MEAIQEKEELAVCGDVECVLCTALLELISDYARADRQQMNAQASLTASWAAGVGDALLVENKRNAESEALRRKDMLFMKAGAALLEREKRTAPVEAPKKISLFQKLFGH